MRLQQGFMVGGMGFGVKLRSSNLEQPVSALGRKQTSEYVHRMSALPPKADIRQRELNVRFVPKADIPRCRKSAFIRSPRLEIAKSDILEGLGTTGVPTCTNRLC
jgi:hypothetical protein